MVTSADRPTNRRGEYRAICLFRKLENRKKAEICNYSLIIISLHYAILTSPHCHPHHNNFCHNHDFNFWCLMSVIFFRYVVCISKGMKPHLVLNDEEKQQRFEIMMMNFLFTLKFLLEKILLEEHVHILMYSIKRKAFKIYLVEGGGISGLEDTPPPLEKNCKLVFGGFPNPISILQ